ncbi:conserved hypothetical protein [Nitrosopumilaceae archaeon]|nr:hypothetical protein [Nitrosopumilus sp.]CAI9831835.1 conserved hypothetical protein [Nitrosopumilaceae archaeon]MDA7943763.1 hypothetical protein [Nitrosopumilus sp.]MDA7945127.1 hypothetical protein [Nitrosopumilus sp.]MDA7955358.1 hypothetical protein [Nitrosopumilus sp.]
MAEQDEFAEALFGQLAVELAEEKEIADLGERAAEALEGPPFRPLEEAAAEAAARYRGEAAGFLGLDVPESRLEFPDLAGFKELKGRKVFAAPGSAGFVTELFAAVSACDQDAVAALAVRDPARYMVYSTYAIQYLSKLSTTYGDYMDGAIYLNGFVLSRYPAIILHKRGGAGRAEVEAGYAGAVKMAVLEETVHSAQGPLQEANAAAASEVNRINEEIAASVLGLDDGAVRRLSSHCRLQEVPDEFPLARRANLFFFLNPDHFLTGQIGPDVMTHTHVEVDGAISSEMPGLQAAYMEWLPHIQAHHAAFTVMEGMAGLAVGRVLGDDPDYMAYGAAFAGGDQSSYGVRKGIGAGFAGRVYDELGSGAFRRMLEDPPTTRQLGDPAGYAARS